MGGTPPYGYDLRYQNAEGGFLFTLRYTPDGSKAILNEEGKITRTLARGESLSISKRDHAKLAPSEPERVELIVRIFKMYADEGKGYKAVADALNQGGILTPRGPAWSHIYRGSWTDSTIRAILVNPVYVGDMVWNRRTDGRFHKIHEGQAVDREDVHGARWVPNQQEDWIVVRDAHPPLVSRRLFEQAKQQREDHPSSIEQRGRRLKTRNYGKTWNGQRSRFILSGLLKCGHCGCRYQGITKAKGKKRSDGTPVKTYYYGCGGYITKGRSICELNPIPQEALESKVIEAVLDFYKLFLDKEGHRRLADAVKTQVGSEAKEFVAARKRAQKELDKIGKTVSNLLDNITPTNREFVDQRLGELKQRKHPLEARLEELDRLVTSQAEIRGIVADADQFLSGLESVLREGLAQEKLAALRRCVEKISINKPDGTMRLTLRSVPFGNLEGTEERVVPL